MSKSKLTESVMNMARSVPLTVPAFTFNAKCRRPSCMACTNIRTLLQSESGRFEFALAGRLLTMWEPVIGAEADRGMEFDTSSFGNAMSKTAATAHGFSVDRVA